VEASATHKDASHEDASQKDAVRSMVGSAKTRSLNPDRKAKESEAVVLRRELLEEMQRSAKARRPARPHPCLLDSTA
jgi:hypothetical protein